MLTWLCSPCCVVCCAKAPKEGAKRGGCCDVADGSSGKTIRSLSIIGSVTFASTAVLLRIGYGWVWDLVQFLYDSTQEIEDFCLEHTDSDDMYDDISMVSDTKKDVRKFCIEMTNCVEYFYNGLVQACVAQSIYTVAFVLLAGWFGCIIPTVNRVGFLFSLLVLAAAIAVSITSATSMDNSYTSFTNALEDYIDTDSSSDFWDTVANVFLGFTIAVLIPLFYAAPVALMTALASFASRSAEGANRGEVDVAMTAYATKTEVGPSSFGGNV